VGTIAAAVSCWYVLQHGFTPLHLAVDNNHTQLAKLLLDKGATPDAADTVSAELRSTAQWGCQGTAAALALGLTAFAQ
jgi:hypothetical protein